MGLKRVNLGMNEYNNLEFPGNDEGVDKLT